MANRCTRRLVNYFWNERVFCLTDKHLPYSITLEYERTIPHTRENKVTFVSSYEFRVKDPKEFIKEYQNGRCDECGDVSKCCVQKYKFNFDELKKKRK